MTSYEAVNYLLWYYGSSHFTDWDNTRAEDAKEALKENSTELESRITRVQKELDTLKRIKGDLK